MRLLVAVLRTSSLPEDVLLVIDGFISMFLYNRIRTQKGIFKKGPPTNCIVWMNNPMREKNFDLTKPRQSSSILLPLRGWLGNSGAVIKGTDADCRLYYKITSRMSINDDCRTDEQDTVVTVYVPRTPEEYLGKRTVTKTNQGKGWHTTYIMTEEEFLPL